MSHDLGQDRPGLPPSYVVIQAASHRFLQLLLEPLGVPKCFLSMRLEANPAIVLLTSHTVPYYLDHAKN